MCCAYTRALLASALSTNTDQLKCKENISNRILLRLAGRAAPAGGAPLRQEEAVSNVESKWDGKKGVGGVSRGRTRERGAISKLSGVKKKRKKDLRAKFRRQKKTA